MACAGAMPYCRDFPATTRIQAFQAKTRQFCVAVLMLAWTPHLQGGDGKKQGKVQKIAKHEILMVNIGSCVRTPFCT